MEAREISLSPVEFQVESCFQDTLQLLSPLAQEKQIGLRLEVAPDVPDRLLGDDRRITQILMNIVGNAVKFTEQGEVCVSVSCKTDAEGIMLSFGVADTGIGIAQDMLTRVFEQFSQADAAISRRFGGTGLGLAISQKLAVAMGGGISVTSTLGEGSCFTVDLRLEPAQPTPETAPLQAPKKVDLGGARILVAEDNQVNRLLVQKFLKDSGAQLGFALDGAEAVERIQSMHPQIVLMDLSMPNVTGLEATRAVRALDIPQPYIIALTANAFEEDRQACMDAGMDDFLTKPVGRQQLLDRLQQALGELSGAQDANSFCVAETTALKSENIGR